MSRLATEADLAEMLQATERNVADWRREHGWPHERFGRSIRYTSAQVEQILASHEHKPNEVTRSSVALAGQTKRSARRLA